MNYYEHKARLRLEAAAPELYEACCLALDAFGDTPHPPGPPSEKELAQLDAVLHLMHAIAKAGGKTP